MQTLKNFLRKTEAVSILILSLLSIQVIANPGTAGGKYPEQFHPRGGLPNFFGKIKPGKEVRVAYIGGSITEAANGWRDLTFNWLKTTYPQTVFTQTNATIGGTGSNLGVFRMDADVLAHKPDLVFVEFAVNDGGPAEGIQRSMEGIVRKTWKILPETDICFVYTIAENVIPHIQAGRYQPSAEAMESIAAHYHIPSIHAGVEVIRLMDEDKLVFTGNPEEHPGKIVFTRDRTHPLAASGHPLYAHTIVNCFKEMEDKGGIGKHTLQSPFRTDNWENAVRIPVTRLNRQGSWNSVDGDPRFTGFATFMPNLTKAGKGAELALKFKGKFLGIYDVIGPETGIIDVIIDGQPAIEMVRFDAWCNNFRKNAFFLKELGEGVHEIKFIVSGRSFDKKEILAKRKIEVARPADYVENGWIPDSILLVGEIVE